eukprot:m.310095 g.310095  ORF g.310095 m.310095 type:complete len:52 (+) comp49487_c0_seq1:1973-2128(+)
MWIVFMDQCQWTERVRQEMTNAQPQPLIVTTTEYAVQTKGRVCEMSIINLT